MCNVAQAASYVHTFMSMLAQRKYIFVQSCSEWCEEHLSSSEGNGHPLVVPTGLTGEKGEDDEEGEGCYYVQL